MVTMAKLDDAWLQTVDRFAKVGSRHHVIPRFVLKRWADSNDQVWMKSKHDRREGIRGIRDLAIKDFYTFLATDGQFDATFEEVLTVVEDRAAPVLTRINNPYVADIVLSPQEYAHLAQFVAFQIVRSPRRRREYELMVDWYAKTYAAGTMPDTISEDDLRTLEFLPHQNEHLAQLGAMADTLAEVLMTRPVALVSIDRPLLWAGDEMVILNTAGDPVHHQPDCALTDEEFQRKLDGARRRKRRQRGREVRRLLHIYTTQPRDIEAALEIVMPISPRTILLFGPATQDWRGAVDRDRLQGEDADRLAAWVNDNITHYSLDVIVGRRDDPLFRSFPIPDRASLLAVCGPTGAARDAVMSVPKRLRPRRLDRRTDLDPIE